MKFYFWIFFFFLSKVVKLPIYLCCDRIKYLLACSVNDLKGGCLGKPVQSLVYLGRSTVPPPPPKLASPIYPQIVCTIYPLQNCQVRFTLKSPSPIYPQIAKSDLPSNRLYDLPPPKSPSPIYPQIAKSDLPSNRLYDLPPPPCWFWSNAQYLQILHTFQLKMNPKNR